MRSSEYSRNEARLTVDVEGRTCLGAPRVVREGRSAGWVLHVPAGRALLSDGDAAGEGRDGDELDGVKKTSCHCEGRAG